MEDERAAAIAADPTNGVYFRRSTDGVLMDSRPAIAQRQADQAQALANLKVAVDEFVQERALVVALHESGTLGADEARRRIDRLHRAVTSVKVRCRTLGVPRSSVTAATRKVSPLYAGIAREVVEPDNDAADGEPAEPFGTRARMPHRMRTGGEFRSQVGEGARRPPSGRDFDDDNDAEDGIQDPEED